MMIDQCLLNRIERAVGDQSFHGDDVYAIELIHEKQASIDGIVAQPIITWPADQHRASAAITFCANDLGAGQTEAFAKELREGHEGIIATDRIGLAVQKESNVIAHENASYRDETGRTSRKRQVTGAR